MIFDSEDCLGEIAEKGSPLYKSSDLWLIIDHKTKYTSKKSKHVKTITIAPFELYEQNISNGGIETILNPSSDVIVFIDHDSPCDGRNVQDFKIGLSKYFKE